MFINLDEGYIRLSTEELLQDTMIGLDIAKGWTYVYKHLKHTYVSQGKGVVLIRQGKISVQAFWGGRQNCSTRRDRKDYCMLLQDKNVDYTGRGGIHKAILSPNLHKFAYVKKWPFLIVGNLIFFSAD